MSEATSGSDDDQTNHNYKVGQDNIQVLGLDIHNPVFMISSIVIVAFVIITLLFQDAAGPFFSDVRKTLTGSLDWFFVIGINIFILFCLYICSGKVGKVRIGGQDAVPDYSYPEWIAMLFAAGIGIGLMFFGVLEPVYHSYNPPLGIEPGTPEAERVGLAAAGFHWGISAWSVYAVVGLSLAFFCYNRGLPLTLRSAFYPVLGDRVWGWFGHVIDTLAVFATLFGLATSLGYGAEQISAGLNHLFGVEITDTLKILLIVGITAVALCSVVAGMDAGVKRLSEINMAMAGLLLVFVLLAGPTLAVLGRFFDGLLAYGQYLLPLSNPVGREDTGFYHGWTTFYWAWWISWSPFVGMFIARISKGRTVREFMFFVLIAPTLVCFLWMAVFGGTGLEQINAGVTAVKETVVDAYKPELSLYMLLEGLPLSGLVSTISVVLIVIFFVTSSDSGSLVIDTITAGGKIDAPVAQRVFWCTFEGLVAIVLLVGGGLGALQAATVSTGFPFGIVLLIMCYSLYLGLKSETRRF